LTSAQEINTNKKDARAKSTGSEVRFETPTKVGPKEETTKEGALNPAEIKLLRTQRAALMGAESKKLIEPLITVIDEQLDYALKCQKEHMPLPKQLQVAEAQQERTGDRIRKAALALSKYDEYMKQAM